MSALYKTYILMLAERLREELEEKEVISHNQKGFREEMGTVDNIYVLNYMVDRQTERKGGKMVAFFVDLKAAFASMDRRIFWKK